MPSPDRYSNENFPRYKAALLRSTYLSCVTLSLALGLTLCNSHTVYAADSLKSMLEEAMKSSVYAPPPSKEPPKPKKTAPAEAEKAKQAETLRQREATLQKESAEKQKQEAVAKQRVMPVETAEPALRESIAPPTRATPAVEPARVRPAAVPARVTPIDEPSRVAPAALPPRVAPLAPAAVTPTIEASGKNAPLGLVPDLRPKSASQPLPTTAAEVDKPGRVDTANKKPTLVATPPAPTAVDLDSSLREAGVGGGTSRTPELSTERSTERSPEHSPEHSQAPASKPALVATPPVATAPEPSSAGREAKADSSTLRATEAATDTSTPTLSPEAAAAQASKLERLYSSGGKPTPKAATTVSPSAGQADTQRKSNADRSPSTEAAAPTAKGLLPDLGPALRKEAIPTEATSIPEEQRLAEQPIPGEGPEISAAPIQEPEGRQQEPEGRQAERTADLPIEVEKIDDAPSESEPLAMTWYKEQAKEGDKEAAYNLAMIYDTGFGVPVDYKKAMHWYAMAANKGHTDALLRLGMLYIVGKGSEASTIKGSGLVRRAAEKGDSLARMLNDKLLAKPVDGLDVPATVEKIRTTFYGSHPEQAAEQLLQMVARAEVQADTNRKASRFKGNETGSGAKSGSVGNPIPSFLAKTEVLSEVVLGDTLTVLRRHAKEGVADAQYEWGRMLETGNQVQADKEQALHWYSLAAAQEHPGAQYRLAIAHLYGIGVKPDPTLGTDLLKKAATQNHPLALKMQSYIGEGKDRIISPKQSVALPWNLEFAMEGNDGEAMVALGQMFVNGWGVRQDAEEGQHWLRKARTAGGEGADRQLRHLKADQDLNQPERRGNLRQDQGQDQNQNLSQESPPGVDVTASTAEEVSAAPPEAEPMPARRTRPSAEVLAAAATPAEEAPSSDALLAPNRVFKGTLPANSRAARETAKLGKEPGSASPKTTKLNASEMGFLDKVKYRATTLFQRDDHDSFKPVLLLFMGSLLGLSVYRFMKSR